MHQFSYSIEAYLHDVWLHNHHFLLAGLPHLPERSVAASKCQCVRVTPAAS